MIENSLARVIAFYLPQYHPIPENDEWWGKGFTEWTNVAKAKSMYRGHYQPHVPSDLGFYDLRVPETRKAQAEMAREYGIEAFCYYHYWFGGKQLLERPFAEVLASGEPDFPFCLCWANQTWTGVWHGAPNRILIEQTYPGYEDHRSHFNLLLNAFRDKRYITVDGKPLFVIFQPSEIPEIKNIMDFWRELAKNSGLEGLYLVGYRKNETWLPADYGLDALVQDRMPSLRGWISRRKPLKWLIRQYQLRMGKPTVYSYKSIIPGLVSSRVSNNGVFPCVVPNWDNTPRSGKNGLVLHGSTPELFRIHLKAASNSIKHLPKEHKLIFMKSWNEWAEGNHLEPDLRFGKGYLEVIKDEIFI